MSQGPAKTMNGDVETGDAAADAGATVPGTVPATGRARLRRAPRRPSRYRQRLVSLASLLVVLVVWEIVGRQMNPILVTYPTAIAREFGHEIADGTLLPALGSTLQPLFLGYFLAAVAGIPLGLMIGRYRTVESAVGFYVTGGYAMPMVALTPLFLLWFGLGFTVKVAIVFVMTIFPIIIATWTGVMAVPRTLVEVGQSFVASQATIMRKIIFPATLPHIMTGLRLGIGRAVIGVVIAEFFTALSGLGGEIIEAGQRFDTAALFVPVVILMALGVGLTSLVSWLERFVAPWNESISGGRNA